MFQLDYDELFGEPTVLVDADIGRVLSPSLRRLLSFVYTYTQVRVRYINVQCSSFIVHQNSIDTRAILMLNK